MPHPRFERRLGARSSPSGRDHPSHTITRHPCNIDSKPGGIFSSRATRKPSVQRTAFLASFSPPVTSSAGQRHNRHNRNETPERSRRKSRLLLTAVADKRGATTHREGLRSFRVRVPTRRTKEGRKEASDRGKFAPEAESRPERAFLRNPDQARRISRAGAAPTPPTKRAPAMKENRGRGGNFDADVCSATM